MSDPIDDARDYLRQALGALMEFKNNNMAAFRNAILEEAAKIADGICDRADYGGDPRDLDDGNGRMSAASEIATAIRALKHGD
jgi:hypothetical protein